MKPDLAWKVVAAIAEVLVVVGCLLLIPLTQQKGIDGGIAIAVQPDLSEGSDVGKILITLSNRSKKHLYFEWDSYPWIPNWKGLKFNLYRDWAYF